MHLPIIDCSITFFHRYGYTEYKETADWLLAHTEQRPKVAVICGSGLGSVVDLLSDKTAFPYEEIPHFPVSTGKFSLTYCILVKVHFFKTTQTCYVYCAVQGHAGQLVFGKLQDYQRVCMQGRFHFYEGYDMHTVSYSPAGGILLVRQDSVQMAKFCLKQLNCSFTKKWHRRTISKTETSKYGSC